MSKIVTLHSFGESHGKAIGGVLNGIPAGVPISLVQIQQALARRRPGHTALSSPRKEADNIQILSGIFEGKTLGTPIGFVIPNKDARSHSYERFKNSYRPSHADYTYDAKYGHRDWRGGGRASARETACRVAAGSIASQVLQYHCNGIIRSWVTQIGSIQAPLPDRLPTSEEIENNPIRCPHQASAQKMELAIKEVRKNKDSLGGIIHTECHGFPAGWGEPVFDKLEADLAKAMLSIPASKGIEFGAGFAGSKMKGSEHNDPFCMVEGKVQTRSNHSGGIQGGISNGMPIVFRVAFKPVATIFLPQDTINTQHEEVVLTPTGRHDPCVLPRAVPIVEAMTALTLCDMMLRQRCAKI